MSDEIQYDVFLSHSAKDKAVVCPLAEQLRTCRTVASERRREAGPCGSSSLPFRDPLNSAFAPKLWRDMLERRFIRLGFDDAAIKGSLAKYR